MSKKVVELAAKLDFDTAKIMQKISKNASAAQKRLDAAVLADSNKYCPMQTGTLQKSAIINTVIGSGRISWVTPYARKQYYEYPSKRHNRNPNATGKWFETVKARRMKEWERIANEGYREAGK